MSGRANMLGCDKAGYICASRVAREDCERDGDE